MTNEVQCHNCKYWDPDIQPVEDGWGMCRLTTTTNCRPTTLERKEGKLVWMQAVSRVDAPLDAVAVPGVHKISNTPTHHARLETHPMFTCPMGVHDDDEPLDLDQHCHNQPFQFWPRIDQSVMAIRYSGSNQAECLAFSDRVKQYRNSPEIGGTSISFYGRTIKEGDWIVKDVMGIRVMSDAHFRDCYSQYPLGNARS